MQEPVPQNFKLPQLESYDGTSDPVDHLEAFRTMMLLHDASDAMLCRAFPSTLKEAARNWYSTLKPSTIFSFDQMSSQFAAHFISSRRPSRGSDSLMNVKQKQGESIRAYVIRFNAAALEVRDLDQSIAMAALKGGIQKNNLLFSLEKRYPRNFADLLARAEKYARAEEAFKLKDEKALRERWRAMGSRMKFDCAHGLPSVADGPELLELTEKREEVLLPKDSTTTSPSTLLELRSSPKLRTNCQDQKGYGLPQTSVTEASTASTITTTATTLRSASSSETKSRSLSERGGWINSFDASLKISEGRCRNKKR
ncbi:hypothetical protein COCNU_scaffold017266G000020 [Cocos nucifera]|nr:hypothetical protein [Cocos nucifera]